MSERRACRVIGCCRMTMRYEVVRRDDPVLRERLKEAVRSARGATGLPADLAALTEARLRPMRHRFQMVFQDPYGSLDPHHTAREIVAEPLRLHGVPRSERPARVHELLESAGVPEPELRAQLQGMVRR